MTRPLPSHECATGTVLMAHFYIRRKTNMKCTAIVLSAGKGKRMGTDRAKQYLDLCGRPVLYYCLKAFQDSFIDEIIII